jgi:hypothetical protein
MPVFTYKILEGWVDLALYLASKALPEGASVGIVIKDLTAGS